MGSMGGVWVGENVGREKIDGADGDIVGRVLGSVVVTGT